MRHPMTLHEAIKIVLNDEGKPMSSTAIAARINQLGLYSRRDGASVPSSQIIARISNYPEEFYSHDGLIFLKEYNRNNAVEEQILRACKKLRDLTSRKGGVKVERLLELILMFLSSETKREIYLNSPDGNVDATLRVDNYDRDSVRRISFDVVSFLSYIHELVTDHTNRTEAIKVIAKYFLFNRDYRGGQIVRELPEVAVSLLQRKIHEDNVSTLDIVDNCIPLYLLDLLNTDDDRGFHVQLDCDLREVVEMTNLILIASGLNVRFDRDLSERDNQIGICIPPFGLKPGTSRWDSELAFVFDQFKRLNSTNGYQLLVGTTAILTQKGSKRDARMFAIGEHSPSGIFVTPFSSEMIAVNSLALVEFDYSQSSNGFIFMGDFVRSTVDSVERAVDIIWGKEVVEGYSSEVQRSLIEAQEHSWLPSLYLNLSFLENLIEDTVALEDLVQSVFRGRRINKKALYPQGEVKFISIRDLNKDKALFRFDDSGLGVDQDQVDSGFHRVPQGAILMSLLGSDLKPNIFNLGVEAIVDQHIIVATCHDNVLPGYLVHALKSELSKKQLNALRIQGVGIPRISRSDLMRLRIKVPSIEEQQRVLLEQMQSDKNLFKEPDQDGKLDSEEFNFIATLKHTLKQPLTTLSEDFRVLEAFLKKKSIEGVLPENEIIVELFEGEDGAGMEKHTLIATLQRCQRMIGDAHDHLNKSEQLLKIDTIKPKFEVVSVRSVLSSLKKDNPNIEIDIKGRDYEVNLDKYSFRILIDNLIENAVKHGFDGRENPKILFSVEIEKDKFEAEYVKIQYSNNGESLSPEMDTDKFLKKNSKSNKSAGDGYGGFLISKIMKMHKGIIEIDKRTAEKMIDYNVCFNLYLPKL
ncbi:restriction endonuclease subunit S [Sanyastnella coralliicola]|uniref:restriction endonuclease subunit S n=1 Tax=Sanyastnella coralliicola TaxID=3069118 RepID=UPI0027BA9DDD|nr:restriction endonuclease subunit S [Longitalea sp. SCSIO 12813]